MHTRNVSRNNYYIQKKSGSENKIEVKCMLSEQVSDSIKQYRDISSSSPTDDNMNNVFVLNGKKLDFNTTNTTVVWLDYNNGTMNGGELVCFFNLK